MLNVEPGPVRMTVVMPTRNRPDEAARAASSILRSRYANFRLLIVDQSAVPMAIDTPVGRDPRVTVIPMQSVGVAAARNLGVARAVTPLVAFTDDDCEVEPDWLGGLAQALDADQAVGLVFGTVVAAPYDRTAGFIPAYAVTQPFTAACLAKKTKVEGIGANMALHRAAWQALGGFDETLGSGGRLRAAEETDFAIRALNSGFRVHETPAAVVTHLGFRPWSEAPPLIQGYMLGLGAASAKMLRLSGRRALRPLLALGWRWLAAGPVVDLNHRPSRRLRLAAFLRGGWAGLTMRLDPSSGCFQVPGPVTTGSGVPVPSAVKSRNAGGR